MIHQYFQFQADGIFSEKYGANIMFPMEYVSSNGCQGFQINDDEIEACAGIDGCSLALCELGIKDTGFIAISLGITPYSFDKNVTCTPKIFDYNILINDWHIGYFEIIGGLLILMILFETLIKYFLDKNMIIHL